MLLKNRLRAAAALFCGLLLCLWGMVPTTGAAEEIKLITIRNQEESPAKVAFLYKIQDGWKAVGWHALPKGPEEYLEVPLPDLVDNEIYALVVFDNPETKQFFERDWGVKEAQVTDGDFSYVLDTGTPAGPNPRAAEFFKVEPTARGTRLWLNLSSSAG